MEAGITLTSFASDSLLALKTSPDLYYQEHHIKATASTMIIGADTTGHTFGTFFLAMPANPAAQRRAQAEIDSVTEGTSLPTFADQDRMPFVAALIQETLRWQSVAPFACSCAPFSDGRIEYRGYGIPKNTFVIPNAWFIISVYPRPHTFRPEHFLLDGKLNLAVKAPDAAFGLIFSSRMCSGRHVACSLLWIAIVSILATFLSAWSIHSITDTSTELVCTVQVPHYTTVPRNRCACSGDRFGIDYEYYATRLLVELFLSCSLWWTINWYESTLIQFNLKW
ncbi:cytochrome P450 [Mycena alexandri]|uniref:Cytochrome P450 n=1 Tax=Mycena alexandri TaxID=1745969 RepID=A0AAD6S2S0_9AGAR|nr:cytochrome P450 [Mycena alexandri]